MTTQAPLSEADLEILLESYRQACEYTRAFMDLRFKHFTSFLVVVAILGGGFVHFDDSSSLRLVLAISGTSATLLFWALDYRTAQYHVSWWRRVEDNERLLRESAPNLSLEFDRPAPRGVSASTITNILFGLFAVMWLGALVRSSIEFVTGR